MHNKFCARAREINSNSNFMKKTKLLSFLSFFLWIISQQILANTLCKNYSEINNLRLPNKSTFADLDSMTIVDDGLNLGITINGSGIATTYELFIDTDNNAATGFSDGGSIVGADFFIQNGSVYRYSSGWVWEWHAGNVVINDTPGVSREFLIAKSYMPLTGLGETINILFRNIDSGFAQVGDPLPNTGMNSYTTTTGANLVSIETTDDINLNVTINGSDVGSTYHLFIDTDSNSGTGYAFYSVGAEYMIENGFFYQYTGSGADWSWSFISGQHTITETAGISRTYEISRGASGLNIGASGTTISFYYNKTAAPTGNLTGSYTTSLATKTTNWTGGTSSVWDLGANWDNGIPDLASTVSIPEVATAPEIIAGTEAKAGDLTITESDGLTINSEASLIVSGTSTGNVTYKRTLLANKWYLVSSPVSGEDMIDMRANNTFATNASSEIGFAFYDNSETDAIDRWSYYNTAATVPLIDGKGYSTQLTSGDISFTGTLNTSNVSIALTQGVNNFNLLGNPSTAFINSGTFLTTNTNELVQEEIYLWNQATGSYETKISSEYFKLAPGQGFFVEANSTNNVTFTQAMQSHESSDTFLKTLKPEIKLNISDGTTTRYAKIYYNDKASKGFDNGYDGKLFGGVPQTFAIYTHLVSKSEGKDFQIQSLPNSDYENMIIPIGVNAEVGKEINITANVSNLPSGMKVYLEDRELKTFHLLIENEIGYTTTLSNNLNGIGRFYLHTSQKTLNIDENRVSSNDINSYLIDKNTLRITGLNQGQSKIKIFNVLGKQTLNYSFNSDGIQDISLHKLASGVYIVVIETENRKLNRKIVLE